MRKLAGEFRAARNLDAAGVENDQASMRVAHIPFGALRRIAERRFLELRLVRPQSRRRGEILRPAAARAPAGIVDAARDRDIERGAIDAGLSAGDDDHGGRPHICPAGGG